MMVDFDREVWEGWTVRNFIDEMCSGLDMIMHGYSYVEPFHTKKEMCEWIKENQPYYKKSIPEVNEFFAKRYGLK